MAHRIDAPQAAIHADSTARRHTTRARMTMDRFGLDDTKFPSRRRGEASVRTLACRLDGPTGDRGSLNIVRGGGAAIDAGEERIVGADKGLKLFEVG